MSLIFVVALFGISLILAFEKNSCSWFPSVGSVLRAFGLVFPTWTGAVVFPSLLGWQLLLMSAFSVFNQAPLETTSTMVIFGFLLLVGSLVWYLLLVGLYLLFLRLLWSEVPQFLRWLEPPKKKRDIFFGWVALSLAVLVGVTPLATWVIVSSNLTIESFRYRRDLDREIAVQMEAICDRAFAMWFIACAYIYEFRRVYRQEAVKKHSAKKSKA